MLVETSSPTFQAGSQVARQIERIVNSDLFKPSESLCRILQYLASRAGVEPGVAVKEYQIAIEALGRSERFNPRVDSCVRVHIGRLRSLLTRYYAGPGSRDEIRVWIPRGSYQLCTETRTAEARRPGVPAHTIRRPSLFARVIRWIPLL